MVRGPGPPLSFTVAGWMVRVMLGLGVVILARKAGDSLGEWALWTTLVVGAVAVALLGRWLDRILLRRGPSYPGADADSGA